MRQNKLQSVTRKLGVYFFFLGLYSPGFLSRTEMLDPKASLSHVHGQVQEVNDRFRLTGVPAVDNRVIMLPLADPPLKVSPFFLDQFIETKRIYFLRHEHSNSTPRSVKGED